MAKLLACRFCRALYRADEGLSRCPECEVLLEPLHALPPSLEAAEDEPILDEEPGDFLLPATFFRRGRGALPALALLGCVAFFLPWIVVTAPETTVYSGFRLALTNKIFWGGFIGNLMLLPLVLTRRTLYQLIGIRIIAALFASLSFVELMILSLNPPFRAVTRVSYVISWGSGYYLTMFVSLAAVAVAIRLGGRLDDLRDLPPRGRRPRRKTPLAAEPAKKINRTHADDGTPLH